MSHSLRPLREMLPSEIPETPAYVYSEHRLEQLYSAFIEGLGPEKELLKLHFAMKANNNPDLLKFFLNKGSGLDLVSGGELQLALELGFDANKLVFSGVGKSRKELLYAMEVGVGLINVESRGELERLAELCTQSKQRARVGIRVNPDVDARTHPYIATGLHEHKFGVNFEQAYELYHHAKKFPQIDLVGISMHIGSQLNDLSPIEEAGMKVLRLAEDLKKDGISLRVLDLGGGLGVSYEDETALPNFHGYGQIVQRLSQRWRELQGKDAIVGCEIGRALSAQSGWLLTRVIGRKENSQKGFLIVDASMSELLRPALYDAQHPIAPLDVEETGPFEIVDVVGPVCESADVLVKRARLPRLKEGDCLSIGVAGAYGWVMCNHYNGRPLPSEWWIDAEGKWKLSRHGRLFNEALR